jgi:hypothetical protein
MENIRDWYLNAEGGGDDPAGHDWETDDRPDRNPDSWLDRLTPGTTDDDADRAPATKQASAEFLLGGLEPSWG